MTPPIPQDHTVVSRMIVRAPNWLGDAVLALPALGALRRHFKEAHLAIAAPAGFADIFRETTDARPDADDRSLDLGAEHDASLRNERVVDLAIRHLRRR